MTWNPGSKGSKNKKQQRGPQKPQDKSSLAGMEGDWSRVQTRASHNTHGDILEDEIKNSKNKKMKFIDHLMCLYGKRVDSIRGSLGVKLVRSIENLSKLKKNQLLASGKN